MKKLAVFGIQGARGGQGQTVPVPLLPRILGVSGVKSMDLGTGVGIAVLCLVEVLGRGSNAYYRCI